VLLIFDALIIRRSLPSRSSKEAPGVRLGCNRDVVATGVVIVHGEGACGAHLGFLLGAPQERTRTTLLFGYGLLLVPLLFSRSYPVVSRWVMWFRETATGR
jgi:hypothetical protein